MFKIFDRLFMHSCKVSFKLTVKDLFTLYKEVVVWNKQTNKHHEYNNKNEKQLFIENNIYREKRRKTKGKKVVRYSYDD